MAGISSFTPLSIDSSVLLGYYNARITSSAAVPVSTVSTAQASSTPKETPPWQIQTTDSQEAQDADVLSTDKFIDTSKIPRSTDGTTAGALEQDNQKLFALYQALNTLSKLAQMSQRDGATTGQLNGYDDRFQKGFAEVQDFLKTTTFNNFTLQSAKPSSTVTSQVSLPSAVFSYSGAAVTSHANLANPLSDVTAADSFTISVKKAGVTTNVAIDLSQVSGGLTLDNIISYVNDQLSAAGFTSRFKRIVTGGAQTDKTDTRTFGIGVSPAPSEQLTLSSAAATPALYVAGTTGSPVGTAATAADNQSRLVKLAGLGTAPEAAFNVTADPDTGTTTAKSVAVDSNGDVYVLGNATGDFGSQLNQADQDVYLSKYDSAGQLKWQELVGSGQTASAYALSVDPTGGVVIAGSTTAHLTQTAISNGNVDSFVAKYDTSGNQTWITQVQTLAKNEPASLSVDATGNVYVGGKVSGGLIGAGQTSSGNGDAYLLKLDNKGKVAAKEQFGTAGADRVAATTLAADGSLVVASLQNGHAIVSKYTGADITTAPAWQVDLGDLQSGDIGGIAVSGGNVYVSGTTKNAALTAGGQASVATASSGGQDAFVFSLTDNGGSASADHVSYVGTAATDKAGGVTVGPDGTVYLTGSTTGTFAGQTRTVANKSNLFVAALDPTGSVDWTRQYGGVDGTSAGAGVAIDAQGSSVLDKLGLPHGKISLIQPVDLASRTTLRQGDSFKIKIEGDSDYTATIRIDKGETMRSLAAKITRALLLKGTAGVTYANHGQALQISLKPGVTATLISGPADSDALARLGIPAGVLTSPAATGTDDSATSGTSTSSSASSSSDTSDDPKVFGLGFSGRAIDIASTTHAGIAKGQILVAMSAITDAYRNINGLNVAPAPAALQISATAQSQIASYQLALNMLTTSQSSATANIASIIGVG